MPRYFFNTADGGYDSDDQGTELPGLDDARIAAIRYAGDVLSDTPDIMNKGGDFRVEITDSEGLLLLTVTMSATRAAAAPQGD